MDAMNVYRRDNKPQVNDTTESVVKIIKNGNENVMIIYDPGDEFTENDLFPFFAQEQITFTIWMQIPGMLKLKFFDYIPKKILFVLSKEMTLWNILSYLATAACLLYGEQFYNRIVTLVTTGELSNESGWICLKNTIVIYKDKEHYMQTLLHKIRYIPPPYFRLYDQGNDLATTLRMSGIGMRNIEAEIFGLFILVGKSCVQIDLKEFHNFRKLHKKYSTSDYLELSGLFKFQKTAAYLVLNGNTEKYLAAKQDIAAICSSVVETIEEKQEISNWDIVCTVRGHFSEKQEKFISSLYPTIWAAMTGRYVSNITAPKHPDFEDEKKRIESFPNDYSAGLKVTKFPANVLEKLGCSTQELEIEGHVFSAAAQ